MNGKTRQKQTLVIVIIAMMATAGMGYSLYTNLAKGSASTVTQLKSNNSGVTASVFQALYITDTDNSNYWVYAPSQYQAMSLLGYQTGASTPNAASVSTIQNCIFFKPALSTSAVTQWEFTCLATITITNSAGTVIGNLTTNMPVAYTAPVLTSGVLQEVISSSISGSSMRTLISQTASSTTGTYTYWEYLTEIGLTIHFTDGTTAILTAPSGMQNALPWKVQLTG